MIKRMEYIVQVKVNEREREREGVKNSIESYPLRSKPIEKGSALRRAKTRGPSSTARVLLIENCRSRFKLAQ